MNLKEINKRIILNDKEYNETRNIAKRIVIRNEQEELFALKRFELSKR